MDFKELLNVAHSNKSEAQYEASVKRYSTTFTAPKKPPRSDVPSDAVLRFLAKKKKEEQQKALEAQKKKAELLALRSQNTKNSKKAKIMASRTKDNDFSRIRLTEDEMEAKKKRETELLRMQLNDKVERMKARIEMEEKEMLLPRKRKRKSKHGDMAADAEDNVDCDYDNRYVDDSEPAPNQKKMSKKMRKEMELEAVLAEIAAEKKKKKFHGKDVSKQNRLPPPPPPQSSQQSFYDLLQLASQKQYEPVKVREVEVSDSDNRPLTKKQRAQYCEDQARAQRKLEAQNMKSSRPVSSKVQSSQNNIPKKNKTVDQNNNAVRRRNEMQQYDDQVISQASQKEFHIPKKSVSQKHSSSVSKNEKSVPSNHPSHISNTKRPVSKHPIDSVKSQSSGRIQSQIPKSGGFSRSVPQNSQARNDPQARNDSRSVSSYSEVQNHKVTAPKQQINGANKKIRQQQSFSSFTGVPQEDVPRSSGTSLRPEKQSSKNLKHTLNKENPRQQIKRVNEKDEDQDFDLFQSDEMLIRTQDGRYVQSNKNFKCSENNRNSLSSSSSKPIKKTKNAVQEQVKGSSHSVGMQKKNIQNVKTSSSNHTQNISNKAKQPVVNRPDIHKRTPHDMPIPEKRMLVGRDMPKPTVNPSLKNKNNIMPSKNVPPKFPNPHQPANVSKKGTTMDSAKVLKGKIPDGRIPSGKVAPVNRPPSAKPEMMKRPAMPPPRPPGGGAGKRGGPKPFHINPYLDPPRRLLEPQRPQRPPMKRRIESDDDDDDDDEDDMSDFIDDGPCYDDVNYSEHIKEIFRYDRSKYIDEDDDDIMESSYAEQEKEEIRSAKLGYLEDLEDMRQEEEEKRRKMMKKKRLKP